MTDINYKILGQKLIEKHPEIAKDLVNRAVLYDLGIIPEITDIIFCHDKIQGINDFEKREIILAVILKLYDPDHLEGYKKMKSGLRGSIAILFKCSPTRITHLSQKVNNLLSIYKDFEVNVDYFVNLIIEKYC